MLIATHLYIMYRDGLESVPKVVRIFSLALPGCSFAKKFHFVLPHLCISGKYCPDPPLEPENGGISTWDNNTMLGNPASRNMYSMLRDSSLTYDASSRNLLPTFFTVAYRCGEARQLFRQDKEGETLFYDEFEITCLWNGTYNKNSSVVR